jgi:hypothetical protein
VLKGAGTRTAAFAGLTAAIVGLASLTSGQTADTPDLAAVERLKREADRAQVAAVARNLTDVYGPRLTGSPHLKASADYVVDRLHAWGIQNASYERWGPFGPGWTTDRFIALALAPQSYPLLAFPKAWTPGTQGEVIADAVFAPIETDQDFESHRGRLRGKFVLTTTPKETRAPAVVKRVYSDDDLAALSQPAASTASQGAPTRAELEFARRRMKFYVDEQVAALLEPSPLEGGIVLAGDGRLRDDSAFAGNGLYPWPDEVAPQLVLAAEQYNRIARMLQSGSTVTLEANVTNSYLPAQPDSFNVIADIPGAGLASQVVMLGAHLDSWHAGTGATDNAAGCAVALEAMRILKAAGLKMRRTVRLALWTGSEQGLQGSRSHVRLHLADGAQKEPKPAHAALSAYFDLDAGTGAIRGLYLEGNQAVAPVFASWMTPFRSEGMTVLSPRSAGDGDHRSFDEVGVPGFRFIQDPHEYDTTRHTNVDTYERLRIDDLTRNAVIVASFVYHAANRTDLLPRKK